MLRFYFQLIMCIRSSLLQMYELMRYLMISTKVCLATF